MELDQTGSASANITGRLSENEKLVSICHQLQDLGMTPKQFITLFLQSQNQEIAYRRRYWGTVTGWPSTLEMIEALKTISTRTTDGISRWQSFIQREAVDILISQSPPSGYYPSGSYISSQDIQPTYLQPEAVHQREKSLSEEHMPFLFNILKQTLDASIPQPVSDDYDQDEMADPDLDPDEEEIFRMEGLNSREAQVVTRPQKIASTVCAMVSFARNRRHNGLQIFNSIRFVAAGVTERMNDYLHLLGLTSSRRTALRALKVLSEHAAGNLRRVMAVDNGLLYGPTICIDNLDMEQRVHAHSVGHRSMTFHGTWGYVHTPNSGLMESLDQSKLSLESYYQALARIPDLELHPRMLLPTREEDDHFEAVLKSQIAQVMYQYVAKPSDPDTATPRSPPAIDKISCSPPNINVLKLMEASDNSAEGLGQVIDSIIKQTGLDPEEFCSRLQILDGDLGTAQNFNSIRAMRTPSEYCEHHLKSICFQLGASHTLWNLAQAILTSHFGNPSQTNDLGTWHYLHALGIPSEKAIPKKDFTLMLNNIEKTHEASIFYCLRVIMGNENESITDDQSQPTIPTSRWNEIIQECYVRFLSPQARRKNPKQLSPKRYSFLIQLHDFSTIVEANRAMKAGDVGRLMNIWKVWSIMAQALPGLVNYRSYLPRTIILLKHVLPPDLSKFILHNFLVSPSGRDNHFVPKDYYLELLNYWLKFFYNRSGIGTQVARLQEMFSLNMGLLRTMFLSLKMERGGKLIYQSHKNNLTNRSLDLFLRMARSYDLADQHQRNISAHIPECQDALLEGVKLLQKAKINNNLARFKLHFLWEPPAGQNNKDNPQEEPNEIEENEEYQQGSEVQLEI
ncbi:hypothetical protein PGT21_023486 [Puccinia graminis f. sp. tritici]|uniref:DUF6589 domain-containing protein n=1 Tax=Puccinia graminis f. sp. tritici TaxID=56615 RepID=A0A5B0RE44_PUCGR|nr:hypothetical protein PGT21_023486 [Puccinia graminis f. sp. tritici]KAA1123508.1 hypothetical protein PGTUg99_022506 [Puccinia graminis f. sp. tritici]